MDFVFIDNDYYKITLEFTRDFIDNNYDEWIENNNKEEIKISRWEMMIYFKKLNDVSQDTVDYFLIDAESYLTFGFSTHVNFNNKIKQKIEIYKNPVFIKLILLSKDEKNGSLGNLKNHIIRLIELLNQFEYVKYYHKSNEILKLRNLLKGDYFINKINNRDVMDYLSECGLLIIAKNILIVKNITKTSSIMEIILISIVNKHYKEILENVEGYIKYCKTEKIKVDFIKINRFINFIKEYVKSIYGFNMI